MTNAEVNRAIVALLRRNNLPPLPSYVIDRDGRRMDMSGTHWKFNVPTFHAAFEWAKQSDGNVIVGYALRRWASMLMTQQAAWSVVNALTAVMGALRGRPSDNADQARLLLKQWSALSSLAEADDLEGPLRYHVDTAVRVLRTRRAMDDFYLLRSWYRWSAAVLECLGFDEQFALELDEVPVPARSSLLAVEMEDEENGPLWDTEVTVLRAALASDRSPARLHVMQRAAVALSLAYGRNPSNYCLLREEDLSNRLARFDVPPEWVLAIPRIKKWGTGVRQQFAEERVSNELLAVIKELLAANDSIGCKGYPRPLFMRTNADAWREGTGIEEYAHHMTGKEFLSLIRKFAARMAIVSPRTGREPTGDDWVENGKQLITKAKALRPFGEVDWEAAVWDVSAAYEHRTRGYKVNARGLRLPFTQHRRAAHGVGEPLPAPFADLVKALVCVRHQKRGQSVGSHSVFIRATRYVCEAIRRAGHQLGELHKDDLDRAAAMVLRRERETSAYKLLGHMEEFADTLDRYRLTRARLDWRCRRKARPRSLTPDRIGRPSTEVSDRLPKEEAIRALGWLYQTIPRAEQPDDPGADRILILIATVMTCTGLRVGEMLTLPVDPVSVARDGSRNLRYARLKGRADDVMIEWHSKPLLSETVELIEAAVAELREATAGPRQVALNASRRRSLLSLRSLPKKLYTCDIQTALGLESRNIVQFLRSREIPFEIENRGLRVDREALLCGIAKDHWFGPMIPGPAGQGLKLHEALCVVYANQLHRGTRTTLTYAARPVSDQNVTDFLTGRPAIRSAFERYGLVGEDGRVLSVRSHGLRHFLNQLLDEGGAPDLVQTKWFGRQHEADTRAYQHLTSAQRAARVVHEVLDDKLAGGIVEVAKALPLEVAKTFLAARIQAVHDVGPGLCVHDFQMSPCERHLQCTANCNDYLWIKGEEARAQELKRQAAIAYLSLKTVKSRIRGRGLVQADWYRHLKAKYEQLMGQLATLGFRHADLLRYVKEEHRNAS